MDPVTIFQIVGAAVSLGDVVLKCITKLSSIKTKYQQAPIHLSTMIGQLYIVKTALDQLSVWNKPQNDRDPRYRQLASQIGGSLDCFGLLILALENKLDQFDSPSLNDMAAKSRIKFLWSEKEMVDHSILLDRQVNALSLLLHAIQFQTWTQQQSYMCLEESQSVLELAKGCSSSIIGLDDTMSFTSETTANISAVFDFDTLILGSRIYQHAERSHLREAIRAKKSRKDTSLGTVIVEDDVETTSLIRDEISNRTAEGRTIGEFDDHHGNRESITIRKRATIILGTIYLSNNFKISFEPSQQPNIFGILDWWRKSSRHKVIPEHKVHPDSTPRKKISAPKLVILGTPESAASALLNALQSFLKPQHYTVEERLSYCEMLLRSVDLYAAL